MSQYNLLEVPHGSEGYWAAVDLRRRILRNPLGLDFDEQELAGESVDRHLVATGDGGKVVGCLVLGDAGNGSVKMRQVVVEPYWQGKGIGRKLVLFSEEISASAGKGEMVLHAREVAREFYLNLGYEVVGDAFLEVGIQHWKMRKVLE